MSAVQAESAPPAWIFEAVERVLMAGVEGQLTETPEAGRALVVDAITAFADRCDENGDQSAYPLLMLLSTLAGLSNNLAPIPGEDGPAEVVMEDRWTGQRVVPEDEIEPGDLGGQAALLMVRLLVTNANDDHDTFAALVKAQPEVSMAAALLLAEWAGWAALDSADDLPEETRARLAARAALQPEVHLLGGHHPRRRHRRHHRDPPPAPHRRPVSPHRGRRASSVSAPPMTPSNAASTDAAAATSSAG